MTVQRIYAILAPAAVALTLTRLILGAPPAALAQETLASQELESLILDHSKGEDIRRLAAIERAGHEKRTELIPALLQVADSPDMRDSRYRAMLALGELRALQAIPFLKRIIEAAHGERQSSWGLDTYVGYAFTALGYIDSAEAAQILATSLEELQQMDLDYVQLASLIRSLGIVKSEQSVSKLQELLRDEHKGHQVKDAIIRALAEINTPAARSSLQEFADKSTDRELSDLAKDKLASLCAATFE